MAAWLIMQDCLIRFLARNMWKCSENQRLSARAVTSASFDLATLIHLNASDVEAVDAGFGVSYLVDVFFAFFKVPNR